VTKLLGALSGEEPAAKPAISIKAYSYNRLYFDFNHNGDLTDDKVVELSADSNRISPTMPGGMSYASFEFPRIDLTIDVEGTKLAHSFYIQGHVYLSPTFGNVQVSVSSAIRREGDITLEGKPHHLVLLDYNSNGRFDDEITIPENIHLAAGQIYAQPGDMLLIDPKVGAAAYDSPYDPTTGDYRYYVSKMIPIDGRWYDLSISPNGEKLTLTPSTVPLGSVTNGNEAFHALIYGDKGFLKIQGTKGTPIPVPEGQWKLFSYTITHANSPEPAKPAAKTAEKKNALLELLAKQLAGAITSGVEPFGSGPSLVSATATGKCKAVTVRKGETVEFPFGPPYTPTVKAMNYGVPLGQQEQVSLEMQLVGVSGEACTNMMVKGGRPGKPDFTITDPDGKVVQQGSFEYG
jgi:hypothetical protein